MESIGQRLKKLRMEKGLNLEEVNKKTNIHLTILKAIEEDSMINLNPVYIKGFIKIYCKFLGVNPQDYVPEHKVEQLIVPDRPTKETKEKQVKNAPDVSKPAIKIPIKQIVAVVVAILLLWLFLKLGKFVVVKISGMFAKKTRSVLITQTSSKQAAKNTPTSRTEKIPAASTIHLSIRAKDDCFIQLKADGRTQFYGTLRKGRADSWKAKNKIEFSLGNAGAVEIEVNNRLISSLGRKGQSIRNIVITKEGLSLGR